ncbi:MAG: cobalt-precorrin-5B (C(1))-methyltransferase, partial [Candidatus Methanomethylophilaceae archaeon]|nr:cobalt-precorrin-5B (C(1))-methyltransferase [Candidatus Methanomethylophilaceae archaeon]
MDAIKEDERYVYVGGKKLKRGFTTGSCAAAASKAAALMLLSGDRVDSVDIMTPRGIPLHILIEKQEISGDHAVCAVRKDGGDDADATTGAYVVSRVSRSEEPGIAIDGGVGVGRV